MKPCWMLESILRACVEVELGSSWVAVTASRRKFGFMIKIQKMGWVYRGKLMIYINISNIFKYFFISFNRNSRALLANRISFTLGLQGPSMMVDTACSSSMYALDCAYSALQSGECDAAIVGGANLLLHPFVSLQFAK